MSWEVKDLVFDLKKLLVILDLKVPTKLGPTRVSLNHPGTYKLSLHSPICPSCDQKTSHLISITFCSIPCSFNIDNPAQHVFRESNAQNRPAFEGSSTATATRWQAFRQGRHPEGADQKTEKAELGEPKVCAGEAVDGKGDGRVCARHWTQPAGTQCRAGPVRTTSRRARREAQVCAWRLRFATRYQEVKANGTRFS